MVDLRDGDERLILRLVIVGAFFLGVVVTDEGLLGELEEGVPRVAHLLGELVLQTHLHDGQKSQLGGVVVIRLNFVPLHVNFAHLLKFTHNAFALILADELDNCGERFSSLQGDETERF